MRTSDSTKSIYGAIIALQADMTTITRSKEVKTGKYSFKYAPLDSIMEMLKPLFKTHGLAVIQGIDEVSLTTRLVHTSGEWVESATCLNRDHANMQGFGGEVTYKRRYALSALIGLVSDDDNDAPGKRGPGLAFGARSGIGADLPEDWKIYLSDLADDVSSRFNAGRLEQAQNLIDEAQLEDDQIIFFEDKLDSKVRNGLRAARKPVSK
jgi:ERF superfamily